MARESIMKRSMATALLILATVGIFATEWLAFLWPVMALVDAGVAFDWRRKRHVGR